MSIAQIAVLLFVIFAVHEAKSQTCLPGWMGRTGDTNCYLFVTSQKAKSWDDAQAACMGLKGSLIKIDSNVLKLWIRNEVIRRASLTSIMTDSWWTGLKRNVGGSWMWTDGTAINNGLGLWFQGQPTSQNNRACAQMTKNIAGTAMSAIDCASQKAYVCQRPINAPSYCDSDNGWESQNGNCYKFFDYRQRWEDAKMDCENHGSVLARMDSSSNQVLYDLALENSRDTWIGLHTVYLQSGNVQWQWANGTGVSTTYWATQEPNIISGQENYTCAVIHPGSQAPQSWLAKWCGEERQYICQKPEGTCAPGWKAFGTTCYQFNPRYSLSWTAADNYCKQQGAKLIEITSRDIQMFLNSYLGELSESGVSDMWTGLVANANVPFTWNGITPVTYTNWVSTAPTSRYRYKRCTFIYVSNRQGQWASATYCNQLRSFVCQIPSVVAIMPASTPLPRYKCPSGTYSHNYRTDSLCYKFNITLLVWQDARDSCQQAGGDLVTVTDSGLQGFLNRYIRGTMWIGLTDTGTEGTFTWTDGTQATYTNWFGRDVTRINGDGYDCVAEVYDFGRRGTWYPKDCTDKNGFICSVKALNAPSTTPGPSTTPRPWSVNCGPFWEENPSLGFCYQFRDDQKTWDDAEAYCRQNGGHLVSITSSAEQNYITGRVQTMSSIGLWIGAHDRNIEGGWEWIDHSPFSYISWSPGEPNNDQNREDCVNINARKASWSDFNCNTKNGFICKKGSQAMTTTPMPKVTTAVPAGMLLGCPWRWLSFNGRCYLVQKNTLSWTAARSYCRTHGGDLASIASQAAQDFLFSQTRSVAGALWIGLSATRQPRSYEWSDAQKVTFTHWSRGEPNNPLGGNEKCVTFNDQGQGYWSDASCTLASIAGFICNKNPSTMSATTEQNFKIGCPANAIGYSAKCYMFYEQKKTFAAAEQYCMRQKGHLASIPDRFVQSFVASEMNGRHGSYWIGLQTSGTGYYYYYWTNKLRVSYTNWDQDHTGRELGSCASMRNSRPVGLWHSSSCSDSRPFICETKRIGFTTPRPGVRPTLSNRCPYYFRDYNGYCYRLMSNSYYYRKTWIEARDDCRYQGGDLVSFHNATEVAKLKQFVFRSTLGSYWIGLNRMDRRRGYTWSDGSAFTFNMWGVHQPDNHNGQENCVEWDMASNSWRDANCAVAKSYACQVKKGSVAVVTTRNPASTIKPPITCGDLRTQRYWKYYNGACYYFGHAATTWYQARNYCQKTVGGELASIHSAADSNFVASSISKMTGAYYWLGLNELDLNGYKWSDNTPVNYRSWDVNEPNDEFGGQKCVAISTTTGYWGDDNCGQVYQYICKQLNGTKGTTAMPATTPPMTGNCPRGWQTFGNKCYMLKDTPTDMLNYSNAQAACHKTGKAFNLVSISNADEQAFVLSMLLGKMKSYWIGLNQMHTLRRFVWIDNAPVSFTNWDYREPNGSNYYPARREECVEIRTSETSAGKWADRKCELRFGYICQGFKQNIPAQHPTSLPSWCKRGYSVYGQSCYKLVTTARTWNDSSKFCIKDGGHLISIGNQFEQAYIRTLLWGKTMNFWTGMTDRQLKGVYRWSDDWPVLYTNWGTGEPSRLAGEGCVALVGNSTWNDTMCNKKYGAICEITHGTPPPHTSMAPGFCSNSSWISHGRYCYHGVGNQYASWPEAQFYCKRMGMRLATIHGADEQVFLLSYISKMKYRTSYYFWIGFIAGGTGGFEWYDKAVVSYTNWAANEPSNGRLRNAEECVQMHPTTGKWTDTYCTTRRPYLCMTDMVFPTQSGSAATQNPMKSTKKSPTQKHQSHKPGKPTVPPPHHKGSTKGQGHMTVKPGSPIGKTVLAKGSSTNKQQRQHGTTASPGGGGMSGGGVAGLIIGLLVVLALVAVAFVYVRREGIVNVGPNVFPKAGGGGGAGFDNALYSNNGEVGIQ